MTHGGYPKAFYAFFEPHYSLCIFALCEPFQALFRGSKKEQDKGVVNISVGNSGLHPPATPLAAFRIYQAQKMYIKENYSKQLFVPCLRLKRVVNIYVKERLLRVRKN